MKKAILFLLFLGFMTSLTAQTFLGSIAYIGNRLQFKIKATGGAITTDISYFEFNIRYATTASLTFTGVTPNTVNFPGLTIAAAAERIIGGYKNKRFVFTAVDAIVSQTYADDAEYKVFEVAVSGTNPLDIQLVTDYTSVAPNAYYFAVNDGAGNILMDVTENTTASSLNFYPTQEGLLGATTRSYTLSSVALPLQLVDFSAKANNQTAVLTWKTSEERDVAQFDVEKSMDGKTFNKIGEVKANNAPSVYTAIDDHFDASAYYRLKINDLSGSSTLSKIVYLDKRGKNDLKIIRDTEGSFAIETEDKIETVQVTNTIGQILKEGKDKRLSVSDLNAGIYLISVKTDKGYLSQKFFKE
jgi:hypothetical protein